MNPQLYIIAGPNGAGKTTFARSFLPLYTASREFVNADDIAQRLSPGNPEGVAIRAGREMLNRIRQLAAQRVDFSIETTLSGKSYVPWFKELKTRGYETQLFFLWVPEVKMSIDRVAARVKQGGHHVPEATIRRRYAAGIRNFFQIYRPLVKSWTLFDNSHPVLYTIATEDAGKLTVLDEDKFTKFMGIPDESAPQNLKETSAFPVWIKATLAMRVAMQEAIEDYRKKENLLVVWRDGKVYHQSPDEAKKELEGSAKAWPMGPPS